MVRLNIALVEKTFSGVAWKKWESVTFDFQDKQIINYKKFSLCFIPFRWLRNISPNCVEWELSLSAVSHISPNITHISC